MIAAARRAKLVAGLVLEVARDLGDVPVHVHDGMVEPFLLRPADAEHRPPGDARMSGSTIGAKTSLSIAAGKSVIVHIIRQAMSTPTP